MNKKIEKIISGTIASALMFQSCGTDTYFHYEDIDKINKDYLNANNGEIISISLVENTEDLSYINFLNKLSYDIINNPSIAQEFLSDMNYYLAKNGFENLKITPDDYLVHIITGFGDEEINKTIINNDISAYLELVREKGWMKDIENKDMERINNIIMNNPEIVKNMEHLKSSEMSMQDDSLVAVAFAVAAVVAAVVFLGAVVVNYVGAATLALSTAVAVTSISFGPGGGDNGKPDIPQEMDKAGVSRNEILQIWLLKGGDINKLYVMGEEQISLRVNSILYNLKSDFPELVNDKNSEYVKQLIMININSNI